MFYIGIGYIQKIIARAPGHELQFVESINLLAFNNQMTA